MFAAETALVDARPSAPSGDDAEEPSRPRKGSRSMSIAKTIVPAARGAALLIPLCTLAACDEPQGRPPWQRLQPAPEDGELVVADRAFLVDAEPGERLDVVEDELVFRG